MIESLRLSLERNTFTTTQFLVGAGVCVFGLMAALTGRIEILAIGALPIAAMLVVNVRASVLIALWATLIWMSRIPAALEFTRFSYVVYASVSIAVVGCCLRALQPGRWRLRAHPWFWMFVAMLLIAAARGSFHAADIPPWLQEGDGADYSTPWLYLRTIGFPTLLLPSLALLAAITLSSESTVTPVITPIVAMLLLVSLSIIGYVALSGDSLNALAQSDRRNELSVLGLHANDYGALLAVGYGLLLGTLTGVESRGLRGLLIFTLAVTTLALGMTFSRGGYLGFAVVNFVFLLRRSVKGVLIFTVLAVAIWAAGPAAFRERAGTGIETRDVNEIGAGRVENIWLPLLPDVAEHLLLGQGLHSVMWTDVQQTRGMLPVIMSHNGYIDLLLDFGLVGAVPILCWYFWTWRRFIVHARQDPTPQYRGLFYGGHLAMVAFAVCALTAIRLTPTAPVSFLWIAIGILMGRDSLSKSKLRSAGAPKPDVETRRTLTAPPSSRNLRQPA